MKTISNIILSRTDSIGDMVLAVPMAKVLKEKFPGIKVAMLGRIYTKPVALACEYVDAFIDFDDFMTKDSITVDGEPAQAIVHVKPESYLAKRAKELKIPVRVGTANRLYHWFTCNRLVPLTRKRSDLHEAQLNLKLLKPFGIKKIFSYQEIWENYSLTRFEKLDSAFQNFLSEDKYNLILHPLSRGSAREWGLDNYAALIQKLDASKYNILVSGVEAETEKLRPLVDQFQNKVTDISGKLPLPQFLSFVSRCDGLLACSTGPLHVAAATRKDAFGLYAPLHKICAARWGPIGQKAQVFEVDRTCTDCAVNTEACHCIKEILPEQVFAAIETQREQNKKTINRNG